MNKKLENIIYYASLNNYFYKELYSFSCNLDLDEEFKKLPIITKSILRENSDKILSLPYKTYPKSKDLIVMRTSGSTGQYLKIFWDSKDRVRSLFSSWTWRKKYYNITPLDKLVGFHTVTHINNKFIERVEPIATVNDKFLSLSKIDLNDDKISMYLDYLYEYQPMWIHTQPSVLSLLLDHISKYNKKFPDSIRYFESTGEYFDKNLRNKIERDLNIVIANNYGCIETNYIACECPHNHMHIITDNVYVEIADDEGNILPDEQYGNIIVTSLNNHAMPVIRYNTGDIGRIKKDHNCLCGCRTPILELLGVRSNNVIIIGNQKISSYILLYTIEKTNEQLNNPIIQYKVTQENERVFKASFVIDGAFLGWKETIANNFIDNIPNNELKKCKWNIEFVSYIQPDPTTGKLKFFESKL